MAVTGIVFRGGSVDGLVTANVEHPDTLFLIEPESGEKYARTGARETHDGADCEVFALDSDGSLERVARVRFGELPS